MPKPQGETNDPVALEVIRRDKASRWVENLEEKVLFIQQRMHVITDEKEKAILECMLDGLSMVAIGKHMGLSRTHIYNLKESIVCQIAHFGHKEHFKHNVTSEKQCGKNGRVGRRGTVDLLKLDYVMRHPCGGD